MPRRTEDTAFPFIEALNAVERVKQDATKEIRRVVRRLARPMKGKLPEHLLIIEWNTNPKGPANGIFRRLELTPDGKKLFLRDRKYARVEDSPDSDFVNTIQLPEPHELGLREAEDWYWCDYARKIIEVLAEAREKIAKGEKIPNSTEIRPFKGATLLAV